MKSLKAMCKHFIAKAHEANVSPLAFPVATDVHLGETTPFYVAAKAIPFEAGVNSAGGISELLFAAINKAMHEQGESNYWFQWHGHASGEVSGAQYTRYLELSGLVGEFSSSGTAAFTFVVVSDELSMRMYEYKAGYLCIAETYGDSMTREIFVFWVGDDIYGG